MGRAPTEHVTADIAKELGLRIGSSAVQYVVAL
jgi:hypothetical protein